MSWFRFSCNPFRRFFVCEHAVLVILILFFFSCGVHLTKIKPDETIEFEKTGCLGKCKSYKIAVSRNGYSTYEGISNVAKIGKYSRKLKKEENEDLWKIVNQDSLSRMRESYNYGDEDTQQHFLKYYSGEKLIKEIRFGPFPPPVLIKIDEKLEVISEASGWKILK